MIKKSLILLLFLIFHVCCAPHKFQIIESDKDAIISGDESEQYVAHFDRVVEKGEKIDTNYIHDQVMNTKVFKVYFSHKSYNDSSKTLELNGVVGNKNSNDICKGVTVCVLTKENKILKGLLTNNKGEFNISLKTNIVDNLRLHFSQGGFTTKLYSIKKLIIPN